MSSYVPTVPAPEVCRQDLGGGPVKRISLGEALAKIGDALPSPLHLKLATPERPIETALARYWTPQ